jgi:hypothetical protein
MERADDPTKSLDEDTIFQALAKAWKVSYKKIDPLKLDLNLVTTTIPHTFARKHLVLPIQLEEGCLTVATPDPFNNEVIHDIAQVSHFKVKTVVTPKSDIIKLINEFFGFKRSIVAAEHQFGTPLVDLGNLEQYVRLRTSDELPSNDQHIVNAVDHLFSYAFDQRASDVHIEPKRDKSIVRFRIDGTLHQIYEIPRVLRRGKADQNIAPWTWPKGLRTAASRWKNGVEANSCLICPSPLGKDGHEDHGSGRSVPEPGKPGLYIHGPHPIPADDRHASRDRLGLRAYREWKVHKPLLDAALPFNP